MKLILPLILLILGSAAGGGAGYFLQSDPDDEATDHAELQCVDDHMMEEDVVTAATPVPLEEREYARMNNQFVVPVVLNDQIASLMVISLSLEVSTGGQEAVFSHEPRLRDAFLQVMFEHANIGGFNGAFTSTSNMRILREGLQEAADDIMRGHISDVLIVEMVRQDVVN